MKNVCINITELFILGLQKKNASKPYSVKKQLIVQHAKTMLVVTLVSWPSWPYTSARLTA